MKETLKVRYLDTRKMVKEGGSLYISLPKKFCDDNGITAKTAIDIFSDDAGNKIILKRHETKFKEE